MSVYDFYRIIETTEDIFKRREAEMEKTRNKN